ncbi:reverse transcriptase domain, reverse transcriptase zinc-binding domain protein [Tanacetum coccineum]|uniref:Reverse transcriptase domain, reverse transcriptase zinc-binding domain protein n=1 Tax=Tanacetum coccineum TaxID=301880 RepID=A0ABQ5DWF6_9ASTR
MSWGWRKFLKIRNLVKPFIWSRIGNGQRTSAWYDNWSPLCQLSNVISNRDIYSAGFKLDMRVSDIIKDGMWAWPTDWLIKYPMISNMNAPVLTGSDDYIVLRNHSNMDVRFSIATIWDCIRPRNAEVNWFHIVWFSQRIPRHAIYLWLVVNRKLKTQDLLRQWDVKNSGITMFNCPLYEGEPDSHNHLFFGCRKEIKDGECSKDPSDLEVARVAYSIVFSVLMVRLHSMFFRFGFIELCTLKWYFPIGAIVSVVLKLLGHVLSKFSVEVKLELEVNVVLLPHSFVLN